ncbi:two component transcriptional regulator, winged helix family [Beutenbergia cavernae DSM 12333]|uniref:Two component transcriptional regulator, winged helix family n=1 Tax=Beutenbergia cavernae (strain ATCC BAA-8 / DSM 12333 / CCUG 43141 / JCM 11478 / NBRC 16432 / NCIMB 13614 / HKI 0122) TaxID=471853 RepID=C5C000_BEUC1|nr:response regulator transcription factor [Beutenbergia cavernae]ACQ81330.1 two component transcriptional regulator, winged helix family [Beutenbergia cavernae DSM 12333]
MLPDELAGRRVLIVDDDDALVGVLAEYLRAAGFVTSVAGDGLGAVERTRSWEPDLIVLDRMLPGIDGLEVTRRVRAICDAPIIMLTALGTGDDRIAGLEVGADDYVTKPFSPRELVLRIQSVLRRALGPLSAPSDATAGPLDLDGARRRVTRDGDVVPLTTREFDLLAFLMRHPDRAFSREELLEHVWGWTFGDLSTVTVHVRRLRAKIEDDPTRPRIVQTVWGVGYLLRSEP